MPPTRTAEPGRPAAGQRRAKRCVSANRPQLNRRAQLPPAFVVTAENDVLRDEGEAYAHKLTEAGVLVTSVRDLGTVHDFMLLNVFTDSPAALPTIPQATAFLRE